MPDPYRESIEDENSIDLREKFVGGERIQSNHTEEISSNASERINTEKRSAYNEILQNVQQKVSDDDTDDDNNDDEHTIAMDARRGSAHPDIESQVRHLMDLAIHKGPVHAVKVARHISDYYILDKLHDDMLKEKFHKALIKKGLL